MTRRTAIRSERTLIEGRLVPRTVVIEDGRIADVLGFGELADASVPLETATGVLLPGLVDTHVHVNEPGRTEW